jgi:hypothetical protein
MYGRYQLWYELYGDPNVRGNNSDKRILLSPNEEKKACTRLNRDFQGDDIEPDAQKRLELIENMLKNLTWGFLPAYGYSKQRGNTSRAMLANNNMQNMCSMNVDVLRLLCGETITIAERCVLHGMQAITVSTIMSSK